MTHAVRGVAPVGHHACVLPQALLHSVLRPTDEEDAGLQASWSTISCRDSIECDADARQSSRIAKEQRSRRGASVDQAGRAGPLLSVSGQVACFASSASLS